MEQVDSTFEILQEKKGQEIIRRNGIMNTVKYHREINKIKVKRCSEGWAVSKFSGNFSKNGFQQSDEDRSQAAMDVQRLQCYQEKQQ